VGSLLRKRRQQIPLTQEELAHRAGLSPSTVIKIEAGRQQPRPSTVRKLATALKLKPGDLLQDET